MSTKTIFELKDDKYCYKMSYAQSGLKESLVAYINLHRYKSCNCFEELLSDQVYIFISLFRKEYIYETKSDIFGIHNKAKHYTSISELIEKLKVENWPEKIIEKFKENYNVLNGYFLLNGANE